MFRLATKFLPTADNFHQAWGAGFRHAELFTNADVLANATNVIEIARTMQMTYAMHFPNRPELHQNHLEACCRIYEQLSCSAVVIHPPMLRRYETALRQILPDIRLAVETMRVPPDELTAWVAEQQCVTLDMEHIWQFSLRDSPLAELFDLVEAVLKNSLDCVAHVHMPGYLPGQGEHRPMYTSREFCMGIFDLLDQYDYRGLVVSEVDMPFQNAFDLRMDVLLYERWMNIDRT